MLASALFALLPILAVMVNATPVRVNKRFTGVRIESGADVGLCLAPAAFVGGAVVSAIPCEHAPLWDINNGAGSVLLTASNGSLALDGGPNAGAYAEVTIEINAPGAPNQNWFLTGDARVAITDGNACLTVPGADDDEFTMTGKVYTMRCEDNNDYQVWEIVAP